MGSEVADNFINLCRTCMTTVADSETASKQSIYEVPIGTDEDGPNIMELLQIVQPQIIIAPKDDLPKFICSECIKKLQATCKFLEAYKDADMNFRMMIKEVEVNQDINNYMGLLKETLDFAKEIYCNDNNWDHVDETEEINNFNLEMEKNNNSEFLKELEYCPEFEDEFCTADIYDDDNADEFQYFHNPYSEASDNESSTTDEGKRSDQPRNTTFQKNETNLKKRTEITTDANSTENLIIDETAKQLEEIEEPPVLSQNANGTLINKTSENCEQIGEPSVHSQKTSENREEIEEPLILSQNADETFTCQECHAILETETLLIEHMRGHLSEKKLKKKGRPKKQYKCMECNKEFIRRWNYQSHMRTHSDEKSYLCMLCGKTFKALISLNIHMLHHKGEKHIQCPKCPKKFYSSSALYSHMMIHNKTKPFVCDTCGRSFTRQYELKAHSLYHSNIRNFKCEYCDMRFVTAEKQRRHMRTHTGEKPYRCKYCDRAFAQSNDCVKHLRNHLGDNVYQCELCPSRFRLARDLQEHFPSHKDDDEETRLRNLEARKEEERKLNIKFGIEN